MSNSLQVTEGIISRVIPFRENDQIITIFSPDAGLIKVIYKKKRNLKAGLERLCAPLSRVEVVYSERQGEIFNCSEMTCIETFPNLRKDLLFLEAACDMLQVVSLSQMPGKEAKQLYALLLFFLKKIPQSLYPWTLAASFRLKLLKHDGLMYFPMTCLECGLFLEEEAYTQECECFCSLHKPENGLVWNQEELLHLNQLALLQNFSELSSIQLDEQLFNRIRALFAAGIELERL